MKRLHWLFALVAVFGCAHVLAVREIPNIVVGEPSFFRAIEAHTDAPIVGGNKIEVLLNGDETFSVMLRDIRRAKLTITFAQYLYEDGSIAREFAQAFAERCRAGVKADNLLDSYGSGSVPDDLIATPAAGSSTSGDLRPKYHLSLEIVALQLSKPQASVDDRWPSRLYRWLPHK